MAKRWTEHELLIAMNVYCRLPFGKLDQRTPLIVRVAEKMGRTPSSLSMKLCNFASFDPALQARGVKGLPGASRADRAMWDAFHENWNEMSNKSEIAFDQLMEKDASPSDKQISVPKGDSETIATLKVRRHQQFFRNTVLASYEQRCALSLIAVPSLLNASHIIPWSESEERRTDPTNGICLNALYDRAFDRGLITFDTDLRLIISRLLKAGEIPEFQRVNFKAIEGTALHLPHRFAPDPKAIEHHREHIFSH